MNTIDKLKHLLDERGVKHQDHYFDTSWIVGGVMHMAHEQLDGTLVLDNLTPEQVIAATLSCGRLIAEQVREVIYRNSTYNDIYKVYQVSHTDMQAIADELNAAIGGGECKWVWVESWTDTTDGRECDYAHWMPDCGCWREDDYRFSDFDDYEEKPTDIMFCERCGKAVKR